MAHLRELRRRLIVCAATLVVASVAVLIASEPIMGVLLRPLCQEGIPHLEGLRCGQLIFSSPAEPFIVQLKFMTIGGIILSSPIWLYQLWAFVEPALTGKEKRYALQFVIASVSLFVLGTVIGYLIFPAGLRFVMVVLGRDWMVGALKAEPYFGFIGMMLVAFGATFELPVVLFFLGLLGIVSVEQLRRHRKVAIVAIAGLAAIVTPTQDPPTMLGLSAALWAMYELTIIGLFLVERRRQKVYRMTLEQSTMHGEEVRCRF